MRANELTGVALKAHDRALAWLVRDEARNARHSCEHLLAGELDGHTSLACSGEPPKKDGEAALQ